MRLRGEAVCRGYLDPAQTAEAFDDGRLPAHRRPRARSRRAGIWCSPAALKDIIIRKGENISAKEIEDLLYRHPAVGDAAVIGLPDRGARRAGLRGGRTARRRAARLTLAELTAYLRAEGLATHKLPEQLEVVERAAAQRDAAQGPQVQAAGALLLTEPGLTAASALERAGLNESSSMGAILARPLPISRGRSR